MISKQGKLYRIQDGEATANHLYGAIDLGSNTFRLLIGEVRNGHCTPRVKQLHNVRIGEALHRTGQINDQAMERATNVLTEFKAVINRHQPIAVRVCGTAALRIATNRDQLLKHAENILGIKAEVIEGRQEAHLSGFGAFACMKKKPTSPVLLADIGGGSSELMIATPTDTKPEITKPTSIPLGAVNMSELFLSSAKPTKNELSNMASHIEAVMAPAITAMNGIPNTMVGIGGTATALAALDCNLSTYDSERIQDHKIPQDNLAALLTKLGCLIAADRNKLPGLANGRGEIIIGGLMIFITLLKHVSCPQLTVSDGGLLEGILLSIADSA